MISFFFKKKTKINFIIQIKKKNIELNHPGHTSLRKSSIKKNYLWVGDQPSSQDFEKLPGQSTKSNEFKNYICVK